MGNSEYFGPKSIVITNATGAPITAGAPLMVSAQFANPASFPDTFSKYSKQSIVSKSGKLLNPGGKNPIKLWPSALSEHQEEANIPVDIVGGSNTHVGMVFKASTPLNSSTGEIQSISLVLDVDGAGGITENFPYSTQTALELVWNTDDTSNTPITIDTSKFVDSPASLLITTSDKESKYDEVYQTFSAPQDWALVSDISFASCSDNEHMDIQIYFTDGKNRKTYKISDMTADFRLHTISLSAFESDGDEDVNIHNITEWGIQIDSNEKGKIWIDSIAANDNPGIGTISLWKQGAALPSSGDSFGALITSQPIVLKNGVKVIHKIFTDAKNGWPIVNGEYYVITISNCNAKIRGHFGDFYKNGFGIVSTDSSTFSEIAGYEMAFEVFIRVPSVVKVIDILFNAPPGDGVAQIFIEHKPTEKITDLIANDLQLFDQLSFINYFIEQKWREVPKDCYLEAAISLKPTTKAKRAAITAIMFFEPFNIYG